MHSSVRARDSSAQEKALLAQRGQEGAALGGAAGLRHSVGAGLPPPPAGGRGSTSSWGLRASGHPRPAERGPRQSPADWGGRAWLSGDCGDISGLLGFRTS